MDLISTLAGFAVGAVIGRTGISGISGISGIGGNSGIGGIGGINGINGISGISGIGGGSPVTPQLIGVFRLISLGAHLARRLPERWVRSARCLA